jgi:O-antigen/teichoic acid export membrane protein
VGAVPASGPPGVGRSVGRTVARHTLLNLAGTVVPLAVAVVTVPRIIAGYGVDRVGVLTLAISILGYVGIFDLGLGRATTKFMAAALASRDEGAAAEYFWAALVANAVLGCFAGLLLAGTTPFLVQHALRVPPALQGEVGVALMAIAMMIPLTIINSSLTGALEAQQRFDLVNLLQAPAATLVQLVPLLLLAVTHHIGAVVACLAIVRAGLAAATLTVCVRTLPALGARRMFRRERLAALLRFGGWLSVSNILTPLLVSADRFVIGSLLSLSAVAYYATPYDIVTRLSVVSSSLSRSLFPVFGVGGTDQEAMHFRILIRVTEVLAVLLAAAIVPIAALGPDLLRLWVGADFARHAAPVLVVVAVGVFVNSLAFTPYTFVQATGRPDLTAKFHLLEIVVYVPLLVGGLLVLGVVGAALAWLARVTLDAGLLFATARRLAGRPAGGPSSRALVRAALVLGLLVGAAAAAGLAPAAPTARVAAALGLEVLLGTVAWTVLFGREERADLLRLARASVRRSPAAP